MGLRLRIVLATALAVVGLVGCGSDDNSNPAPKGMESVATSFRISPRTTPASQSIEIVINGGYCYGHEGESQTTVNHVEVDESDDEIVLDVYANVWKGMCAGIGGTVRHVVRLDGSVGERPILDGFEDPPTQRWPSPNGFHIYGE